MFPFPSPLLMCTQPASSGGGGGSYGSHKAWRIYINSNNGDATYCTVAEAELRTTAGGATVTSGGTAFQGGPGTDAGNGVNAPWDGNTSNTWARTISGGFGFFFGYMWSTPKAIVELGLRPNDNYKAPVDFKLQYSDDTTNGTDGTWTDAFTAWEKSYDTLNNSTLSWVSWPQDFSGGKYKAFRFLVTANNGDSYVALEQAELHATVGGADFSNPLSGYGTPSGTNAEPSRLWDNNIGGTRWIFAASALSGTCYSATVLVTPAVKPAEYSLLLQGDGTSRAWNSWKLQGSTNGTAWSDLDTRSGITWSSDPQTKTFAVP